MKNRVLMLIPTLHLTRGTQDQLKLLSKYISQRLLEAWLN